MKTTNNVNIKNLNIIITMLNLDKRYAPVKAVIKWNRQDTYIRNQLSKSN